MHKSPIINYSFYILVSQAPEQNVNEQRKCFVYLPNYCLFVTKPHLKVKLRKLYRHINLTTSR